MSFSFGSKKQKSTTTQESQSDPWDVATPYIKDFLSRDVKPLIGSTGAGASPGQVEAFDKLRANAQEGNPYEGQINKLTTDLFGTKSRAPMVDKAYGDLTRRLSPVADGTNLNLEANPYIAEMLGNNQADAVTRANEVFAGSGRSFSGAHAGALGRAVTDATLPTMANLYQYETGRTDAAARDLNSAGSNAASTGAELDRMAQTLRSMGIETGNAAIAARDYGPQQLLAIETALRDMPAQQAAKLAAILFPAGQLGEQATGTGTTTGKIKGFSIGGSLFGGG